MDTWLSIILCYWIDVYILCMLEDTWKLLLQGKPGKDGHIMTGQYMESSKYVKLDLIGIYNTSNIRYIVSVHASLFPESIVSIQ